MILVNLQNQILIKNGLFFFFVHYVLANYWIILFHFNALWIVFFVFVASGQCTVAIRCKKPQPGSARSLQGLTNWQPGSPSSHKATKGHSSLWRRMERVSRIELPS